MILRPLLSPQFGIDRDALHPRLVRNTIAEHLTDIDEKIVEGAKDLKKKVQGVLDKTDIDEKIIEGAKDLKEKAQGLLDKTDVDEKIVDGAKNVINKLGSLFGGKDE